jgi:hypothetical protein
MGSWSNAIMGNHYNERERRKGNGQREATGQLVAARRVTRCNSAGKEKALRRDATT